MLNQPRNNPVKTLSKQSQIRQANMGKNCKWRDIEAIKDRLELEKLENGDDFEDMGDS